MSAGPVEKTGNNTVLECMVNEYGRLVTAICRRMLHDEETAKDASQEVWLEVIRSYPSFKNLSKASTWIYTIARRVVMAHAQKERKHRLSFLEEWPRQEAMNLPCDMGEQLWVKETCDRCLTGTLHCLDKESRLAYIFRDIAQLPYKEIAGILEKEPQTVRQMISRSRRRLRNFLTNECPLYNPQGRCRCHMREWVEKINLPEEYRKIRAAAHRVNLFRESETILPKKNFWEQYL